MSKYLLYFYVDIKFWLTIFYIFMVFVFYDFSTKIESNSVYATI